MPAPKPILTRRRGASPAAWDFRTEKHAHLDAYQRLAAIDPPALRSLVVDLNRVSDESAAAAAREDTPEAAARAHRNAARAAAARSALDALAIEN